MILPRAPSQYEQSNEQQMRDALAREDQVTPKFGRDIELARGERLILRASNGSRWALTVSTAGVLGTTPA